MPAKPADQDELESFRRERGGDSLVHGLHVEDGLRAVDCVEPGDYTASQGRPTCGPAGPCGRGSGCCSAGRGTGTRAAAGSAPSSPERISPTTPTMVQRDSRPGWPITITRPSGSSPGKTLRAKAWLITTVAGPRSLSDESKSAAGVKRHAERAEVVFADDGECWPGGPLRRRARAGGRRSGSPRSGRDLRPMSGRSVVTAAARTPGRLATAGERVAVVSQLVGAGAVALLR